MMNDENRALAQKLIKITDEDIARHLEQLTMEVIQGISEVVAFEFLTLSPWSPSTNISQFTSMFLRAFLYHTIGQRKELRLIAVGAAIYLRRLKASSKFHLQNNYTPPHCITIAAMSAAAKFLDDKPPKNEQWITFIQMRVKNSISFSLDDLNRMEKVVLADLKWDMLINMQNIGHELKLVQA